MYCEFWFWMQMSRLDAEADRQLLFFEIETAGASSLNQRLKNGRRQKDKNWASHIVNASYIIRSVHYWE